LVVVLPRLGTTTFLREVGDLSGSAVEPADDSRRAGALDARGA
jgi:hypothetical protein